MIRTLGPFVSPGMSQNVAIVKQFYDAFGRGDMPAAFALLHPEVELHEQPSLPWGRVYKGIAGMQEFLGELGKWLGEGIKLDVRYLVDAPDNKVVARTILRCLERSFESFEEWQLVEGRIRRIEPFTDTGLLMARLSDLDKL
jgi:ketosteroid isomerase-like protein